MLLFEFEAAVRGHQLNRNEWASVGTAIVYGNRAKRVQHKTLYEAMGGKTLFHSRPLSEFKEMLDESRARVAAMEADKKKELTHATG